MSSIQVIAYSDDLSIHPISQFAYQVFLELARCEQTLDIYEPPYLEYCGIPFRQLKFFFPPILQNISGVEQIKEGPGPTFRTYKTVDNSIIMSLSQLLERFSKKQFFGHTRNIFFGEDVLKDEKLLKEILDGISRYHEFHNSMYAYIVPGRAEEVFKVKPMYNKLLGPYIAGIVENSDYTSKVIKLTLSDMIIMLENQKGGLVIPRINPGKEEVKISGAGVLKDYKLIGYLDDQETSVYNWLTDKAKGGDIAVEYKGISTVFRHFDFDRKIELSKVCLLYTSPSPRDRTRSRMPSSD